MCEYYDDAYSNLQEPLLPQDRTRKGKKHIQVHMLLDVARLARAKHGTAAQMRARQLSKAAAAKRSGAPRLASRAVAQRVQAGSCL